MTKSIFFATLFFCLLANNGFSQNQELISSKKLLKDFDQLVGMLEAHPAPYRHLSEEEFDLKVNEARQLLSEPQTIEDYYKIAASILALAKDGHTRLGWPIGWLKNKRKEYGAFPYEIHLSNSHELFLLKYLGEGEGIPKGAKVLSINDVSIKEFLNGVDPWISYERLDFRNAIIEDFFEEYLLLYFGKTDDLTIKYLSTEEHYEKIVNMPLGDWKSTKRKNKEAWEKKMEIGEPFEYKKIKEGIGLIKMYSFSVGDFSKFESFLTRTFKAIEKDEVRSLIIDVRGNYGGAPKVASALLHYLTESYFKTMAKSEMKISKSYRKYFRELFPAGFNPNHIRFYQLRHNINLNAVFDNEIGSYFSESTLYNETPKKPEFSFSGNLFLLTDRRSYSASSSFAATFRCYQMGYIIGEETGGTKVFHANAMPGLLSNTRIPAWVATTRLYTACYHLEDDGIVPDVAFSPTTIDLLSGADAQLNYALFVIKKMNKAQK